MSFDFEKDKNKHIHFIGIGGVSMSGLAEILLNHGYRVSGSDMKASQATEKLAAKGAVIHIGHESKNIEASDLIVYTAAISEDNPELMAAKAQGKALMDRAEFLGYLMRDFKYSIAVSGTHGKTTTTSMLAHIVCKAQLDPTILVGGDLDLIEGNVRSGKSEYFLTEACEYKASFLKFYPYVGVILNIDADHLDFYRDINHIQDTFQKFLGTIPEEGYVVAWGEDEKIAKILPSAPCNVITYGLEKGDIVPYELNFDQRGCGSFTVNYRGDKLFKVILKVPGPHNVLNALAAIGAALALKLPAEAISSGLESFYGTHRRFERKGEKNGVFVVDDYAHHPTEIKAVLKAASKMPHNRLFCAFQPHTYSRTKILFEDFTVSFDEVDELLLADIYAAREKDNKEISSDMLGDKIRQRGVNCRNFHSFLDMTNYLEERLLPGDLLITVGAGDIYRVGEMYLTK